MTLIPCKQTMPMRRWRWFPSHMTWMQLNVRLQPTLTPTIYRFQLHFRVCDMRNFHPLDNLELLNFQQNTWFPARFSFGYDCLISTRARRFAIQWAGQMVIFINFINLATKQSLIQPIRESLWLYIVSNLRKDLWHIFWLKFYKHVAIITI